MNSLPTVIWYSGGILTLIFFWFVGSRLTLTLIQLIIFVTFFPLVYLFVTTYNLLVLFMCYELFLLPSFLLVFFGSPNRRGVIAATYFLIWTSLGSFLVLISIIGVFVINKSFLYHGLQQSNALIPYLAIVGFGVKVPMWPAHFWLTKTHVEAPTYFSIYLSGFLVKTALYGLWVVVNYSYNINISLILTVAIIGVIDSSLKMWG